MNFIIASLGSAQDVRPFLGIGEALTVRGHAVTALSYDRYEAEAREKGLEFVSAGAWSEVEKLLGGTDFSHPSAMDLVQKTLMVPPMRRVYQLITERQVTGDTVLVASAPTIAARLAQEKLSLPLVTLHLAPGALRSTELPPRFARADLPGWLAGLLARPTYALSDWQLDRLVRADVNSFRGELGLRPLDSVSRWMANPKRVLGLFPEWFAPPQIDWPRHTTLTHFPLFDSAATSKLGPEVEAFLTAGEAPVVFTAGAGARGFSWFHKASVEACASLGLRGILVTDSPHDVPRPLPASVLHVEDVSFAALLPRAKAFVNHAGMGVIAQALRAGVPQLVVPWGYNQFDNAVRVKRLGVAEELDSGGYAGRWAAETLERLIDDAPLAQRCREVAAQFEGVDPIGVTCDALEAFGHTAAGRAPPAPVAAS